MSKFFSKRWEEGEEVAIQIGLDLNTYWEISPVQMEKYVKAFETNEENKARFVDRMNWYLGSYIGAAVNNPKKYPSKPLLHRKEVAKVMTDNEMEAMARKLTILYGGTIK